MNTLPSLVMFGLFLLCSSCQTSAPTEPTPQTLLLRLNHADAVAMAETLTALCEDAEMSDPCVIQADESTNSIVVHGGERRVEQVRVLVRHLDAPGS